MDASIEPSMRPVIRPDPGNEMIGDERPPRAEQNRKLFTKRKQTVKLVNVSATARTEPQWYT
jgi:hypothetical protein